ncbi:autophagy associated protein Atg5 [Schizosaccharomyces japonicus yFS275]|uniref:Autophagy protein 5 n=1 Tax=Schizosaccharomyces japonicus (strain yFS275 / FY16936) TaxID=402676 RepID=B6JUT4_SCHJY|nr:autophagy associated protein Atg5 [Schizosaccharomyces japonicus yFS275]EEB05065.1 autophagy associated protein Atg5 [Schizosaccharomyces japonicus yFS275]
MNKQSNTRDLVWNGSLSISVTTESSPLCYMTNIPRLSYIAFILDEVRKILCPNEKLDNCWLEFEGVPLKSHWPIGVLYDLYTATDPDAPRSPVLWKLVLHYDNFPASQLIPCNEPTTFRTLFFNALKESDYVRNKSASYILSLSNSATEELWTSIQKHDFEVYQRFIPRLRSAKYDQLPVRIYITPDTPVVQESVSCKETLGSMLHKTLPKLFPSQNIAVLAKAIVHGISIPLSTNMNLLNQELCYTDGFVHIVIHML